MQGTPQTMNHNYECVHLTSDELEDVKVNTVDAELDQSIVGDSRLLMIFNGTYLRVRSGKSGPSPDDYWLNLAFLDPDPIRRIDPLWAIVSAVFGLFTVGIFLLAHTDLVTAAQLPWDRIFPVMLMAMVMALGVGAYRGFSNLAFYTRHGRAKVLSLSSRHPDGRRVKQFIEKLGSAVERAVADLPPGHSYYLRDEMKEHRRLQEMGVIPGRQFKAARALILQAHG